MKLVDRNWKEIQLLEYHRHHVCHMHLIMTDSPSTVTFSWIWQCIVFAPVNRLATKIVSEMTSDVPSLTLNPNEKPGESTSKVLEVCVYPRPRLKVGKKKYRCDPFPSPFLPSAPLLFLPLPLSLLLEVAPLNPASGSGSAVSSPRWVWAEPRPRAHFWHILRPGNTSGCNNVNDFHTGMARKKWQYDIKPTIPCPFKPCPRHPHSPSSSIWPHLSYGLVRSKREYYHNCSLVVVLCSFL